MIKSTEKHKGKTIVNRLDKWRRLEGGGGAMHVYFPWCGGVCNIKY